MLVINHGNCENAELFDGIITVNYIMPIFKEPGKEAFWEKKKKNMGEKGEKFVLFSNCFLDC